MWVVAKFYCYLADVESEQEIDHKPLEAIFKPSVSKLNLLENKAALIDKEQNHVCRTSHS